MPNPVKGEVALVRPAVDGRAEETYILVFDDEAIVVLENELDLSVLQFPQLFVGVPKFGVVRVMLWGALIRRHPKVTVAEAGVLAREIGLPDALSLITEALKIGFPQPGDMEDAGAKADPPPAAAKPPRKRGTGRRSTASGSNSA